MELLKKMDMFHLPFWIARNPDPPPAVGVEKSKISVKKVAIFDRALTAKEIQNGFTNDIKIYNPTDLLVYEDFTINQ